MDDEEVERAFRFCKRNGKWVVDLATKDIRSRAKEEFDKVGSRHGIYKEEDWCAGWLAGYHTPKPINDITRRLNELIDNMEQVSEHQTEIGGPQVVPISEVLLLLRRA